MKPTVYLLIVLATTISACEYNLINDESKCYNMQFEKEKAIQLKKYGVKLDLSLIKGPIYKESFANMPETKELTIRSSGITNIEDGFLQSFPELGTLTIKLNHGFPNVTKKIFENCCQNLKILRIYDNNVKYFEKDVFTSLKSLEEIWIEKQKIPIVTGEYFNGLTNLKLLGLQNCNVKEIKDDAFDSLTSLKKMALPSNQIKKLQEGVFKNLKNLEQLQLPFNDIRTMTGNEFVGLSNLKKLDLTGNKVTAFDSDIALNNMPQLKMLVLKFNSVNCDYMKKFADVIKRKNVEVKNINDQVKEFCSQ